MRATSPWARSAGKRAFDLALAVPLLLVVSPVLLALALAIRAGSDGPAIFVQQRLGRGEREFPCRKLRSMRQGTPSVPTHQAPENAITPLGRRLRRFKLDELPQLWNVVTGEMSLVGPRPCLPTQRELIGRRRAFGVFDIRPGITGLAQVRGIDMSDPRACADADGDYAAGASLMFDLWLLARTVFPPLRR